MFSTPTMLLILNMWTGEDVQLSLCTHILKLLLLVLGVFLKMLLLQNVWTGEGVRLSLYTHILILLLPTILDNVLSTLNKIVPSDKSCLLVKFNSRAPSEVFGLVLMHSYLHCYYQCVPLDKSYIRAFLFTKLLLWNTKSNKSQLMFSLKFCHLLLYLVVLET